MSSSSEHQSTGREPQPNEHDAILDDARKRMEELRFAIEHGQADEEGRPLDDVSFDDEEEDNAREKLLLLAQELEHEEKYLAEQREAYNALFERGEARVQELRTELEKLAAALDGEEENDRAQDNESVPAETESKPETTETETSPQAPTTGSTPEQTPRVQPTPQVTTPVQQPVPQEPARRPVETTAQAPAQTPTPERPKTLMEALPEGENMVNKTFTAQIDGKTYTITIRTKTIEINGITYKVEPIAGTATIDFIARRGNMVEAKATSSLLGSLETTEPMNKVIEILKTIVTTGKYAKSGVTIKR